MADKHNIPKGNMYSNCSLLPEDIVCKITQRNNIRSTNTCDPVLKLLNEEITSDIQTLKQNLWKEYLDAHCDYRHNKDIDKGTTYRPISLLSIIAKTLEKTLLPYITVNIPNTPTQHRYKTQHYSDGTTHSSKGVQPNGSPCANNHCST